VRGRHPAPLPSSPRQIKKRNVRQQPCATPRRGNLFTPSAATASSGAAYASLQRVPAKVPDNFDARRKFWKAGAVGVALGPPDPHSLSDNWRSRMLAPRHPSPQRGRFLSQVLIAWAATLFFLWAPHTPALAQGQIFLAVTEVDAQGKQSYWWQNPQDPQWTQSDHELRQLLTTVGLSALDPTTLTDPPRVSSVVYGKPHLSTTNAINLASLFGAQHLLTGTVRLEEAHLPAMHRPYKATLHMDMHFFATNSTIEVMSIALEVESFGLTPAEALLSARAQGRQRLAPFFRRSLTLADSDGGVAWHEPVLVFTGLERGRPLVEIKRQLKTLPGIDDVMEAWAAEGVIAVEINPGQVDAPEFVFGATDALLRMTFADIQVYEVNRDATRIEVAVTHRAQELSRPLP